MKNSIFVLGLVCLSSVFRPFLSEAQAPSIINYQGRLVSGTNLVNGSVGLSLRLFNVPSGGSSIYEDSNSVTVVDGLYSTYIGDDTTFGNLQSALGNSNVWVEIAVNGVALAPRERMASVPYALNVNAGGIAGTIADANLSANIARLDGTNQTFTGRANFNSVSNTFTGTFSGNGAGVTNVDLGSVTAISAQPTSSPGAQEQTIWDLVKALASPSYPRRRRAWWPSRAAPITASRCAPTARSSRGETTSLARRPYPRRRRA